MHAVEGEMLCASTLPSKVRSIHPETRSFSIPSMLTESALPGSVL